MPRGDASGDDVPLEVIDLEPELGPPREERARMSRRMRVVTIVGVAVVAVVVATMFAANRDGASEARPSDRLGRFYPPLESADEAQFVLPSGVTVVLSGDAQRTLDGLGATFAGGIGSVEFRIAHADPSELFRSLGPDAIPSAVAVAGSDARVPRLVNFGRRLAVLSSGDWTLVAFLSDSEGLAHAQLDEVADWRLRPTPSGAVVVAPAAAVVGESSVVLEGASAVARRVELAADNCAGTSLRTHTQLGDIAVGRWCVDGVYVRISGPEPFVARALATLDVEVRQEAN